MKNKWIPLDNAHIPPLSDKGWKESVLIRSPIAPVHRKSSMIPSEQGTGDDDVTVILQEEEEIYASITRIRTKETVQIRKDEFIIGKGTQCDFIITDNSAISRQHVCITVNEGNYYLRDLHSSNHTYINDQKIEDIIEIKDKTIFRLANEEFAFRTLEEE